MRIYHRLARRQGPSGWWPGESALEVCLGAILVQNTSWPNVERALDALRREGLLSYRALAGLTAAQIAPRIRSAGCFNVKARRLAAFVQFLGREYGGQVERMAAEDPATSRRKLLDVKGIGRETADAIVLYAAGLPLFVVDAYTRRVFGRLGLLAGGETYDEVQRFFMDRLPPEAALYNEYHAQIVRLGKDVCRPRPRCPGCPLDDLCLKRGVAPSAAAGAPSQERQAS